MIIEQLFNMAARTFQYLERAGGGKDFRWNTIFRCMMRYVGYCASVMQF